MSVAARADLDVLVVGGGLSGLAAGWWLGRAGLSHAIWEQAPRAGGMIASQRRSGYLTESGASMMLNYRPEVSRLVEQLDLSAAKRAPDPGARRRRYILHDDALVALGPTVGGMLASPLWSWRGRLRLLAEPFIPRGGSETESISAFVRRRLGAEFLERAMEPVIAAVFAADPDATEARAALPRLTALERRHGSLTAGMVSRHLRRRGTSPVAEVFSFRAGMSALTEALARAAGTRLQLGYRVTGLEPVPGGWRVHADTPAGARCVRAAQVVCAAPAYAGAALVRELDRELAVRLARIRYVPLTLVHLAMDRRGLTHALDGGGFLVPRAASTALTAVQWASSLFPERAPPGKALLTAFLGGARCPQTLDWSSTRCLQSVQTGLARWLGMRSDPDTVWFDRHAQALPLCDAARRDLAHLLAGERSIPRGLHFTGNYLAGIATRDCIVDAAAVAARVSGALVGDARAASRAGPVPAAPVCAPA